MVKFLADENLYVPIVEVLKGLGYDVLDAKEDLIGSPDDSLYALAKKTGRILVTMDLDFSNILLYPLHDHCGIIVLRLPGLSVTKAAEIFKERVKLINLNDIKGKVVIIEPDSKNQGLITSDMSSLPEVVSDAAIMVDPKDMEGLAQAIEKVLSDSAL